MAGYGEQILRWAANALKVQRSDKKPGKDRKDSIKGPLPDECSDLDSTAKLALFQLIVWANGAPATLCM